MMVFLPELGFSLPPFAFVGRSRGLTAEDMEQNVKLFLKSKYVGRSVRDLIDNDIKLLRQLKGDPCVHIASPQPKISEDLRKLKSIMMVLPTIKMVTLSRLIRNNIK
jgi:hypothetical protein